MTNYLPWGDTALDSTEIFICLHPLSRWKVLPYLAHRKARKRKSYYSSSYNLLNYTVASGEGSEWWFLIFWQCQITAHPQAPGSSLSMSNTPHFAVTDCKAGKQWWVLTISGLTAHSTASQNQKIKRQESHFCSPSLVLSCSLKHIF